MLNCEKSKITLNMLVDKTLNKISIKYLFCICMKLATKSNLEYLRFLNAMQAKRKKALEEAKMDDEAIEEQLMDGENMEFEDQNEKLEGNREILESRITFLDSNNFVCSLRTNEV